MNLVFICSSTYCMQSGLNKTMAPAASTYSNNGVFKNNNQINYYQKQVYQPLRYQYNAWQGGNFSNPKFKKAYENMLIGASILKAGAWSYGAVIINPFLAPVAIWNSADAVSLSLDENKRFGSELNLNTATMQLLLGICHMGWIDSDTYGAGLFGFILAANAGLNYLIGSRQDKILLELNK